MNTTTTHVVEGTDLPTYESGLTDSGYLYLGGGVKVTVADRHVDYLRQLAAACAVGISRIEARTRTLSPTLSTPTESVSESTELQHPGTWLPGDRFIDDDGDTWTRGESGWSWTDAQFGQRVVSHYDDAGLDEDYFGVDRTPKPGVRIIHLVPRENGADR